MAHKVSPDIDHIIPDDIFELEKDAQEEMFLYIKKELKDKGASEKMLNKLEYDFYKSKDISEKVYALLGGHASFAYIKEISPNNRWLQLFEAIVDQKLLFEQLFWRDIKLLREHITRKKKGYDIN